MAHIFIHKEIHSFEIGCLPKLAAMVLPHSLQAIFHRFPCGVVRHGERTVKLSPEMALYVSLSIYATTLISPLGYLVTTSLHCHRYVWNKTLTAFPTDLNTIFAFLAFQNWRMLFLLPRKSFPSKVSRLRLKCLFLHECLHHETLFLLGFNCLWNSFFPCSLLSVESSYGNSLIVLKWSLPTFSLPLSVCFLPTVFLLYPKLFAVLLASSYTAN